MAPHQRERKAPVKHCSVGDTDVVIWENEFQRNGETRTFLTASVVKSYTTKEGKRATSNSFTHRELTDAKRAIEEALEYMECYGQAAPPSDG